jgi:hypothetical protein
VRSSLRSTPVRLCWFIFFATFGSNKKRKLELKKELLVLEFPEENGKLTTDEMSYRVKMQEELFKLYEEEESYCHQKAHGNGC